MPPPEQQRPSAKVKTRELLRQLPRALALVWEADRTNAVLLGVLTLVQSGLPAAMAWVGKLIIDAVVKASAQHSPAADAAVWRYVSWELGLALVALLVSRLLGALARAVARQPGQPAQRAHPREVADARAAPLRGLRDLRHHAERAARGVVAAAGAGDRRGDGGAQPAHPVDLRGAAVERRLVERAGAGGRRHPVVHRRDEAVGRALPPLFLARARGPQAQLPGVDPHPRLHREGGEALRAGPAHPGALPRAVRQVPRGRSQAGPQAALAAARCWARSRWARSTSATSGWPGARRRAPSPWATWCCTWASSGRGRRPSRRC